MDNEYSPQDFENAVRRMMQEQKITREELDVIYDRIGIIQERRRNNPEDFKKEVENSIHDLVLQSFMNNNRKPKSRKMIYLLMRESSNYEVIKTGNFRSLRSIIRKTELGQISENVVKNTYDSVREFLDSFAKLDKSLQDEVRNEIISYYEAHQEEFEREFNQELIELQQRKAPSYQKEPSIVPEGTIENSNNRENFTRDNDGVTMPNIVNNAALPMNPIDMIKANHKEFYALYKKLLSEGYINAIQEMLSNHVLPNSDESKKIMEKHHVTDSTDINRYFELLDIISINLNADKNQSDMRQLIASLTPYELDFIFELEKEEEEITLATIEKKMEEFRRRLNLEKILKFFSIKSSKEKDEYFKELNEVEQKFALDVLEKLRDGKTITKEELEEQINVNNIDASKILRYFELKRNLYNDVDDMILNHLNEIIESNRKKRRRPVSKTPSNLPLVIPQPEEDNERNVNLDEEVPLEPYEPEEEIQENNNVNSRFSDYRMNGAYLDSLDDELQLMKRQERLRHERKNNSWPKRFFGRVREFFGSFRRRKKEPRAPEEIYDQLFENDIPSFEEARRR